MAIPSEKLDPSGPGSLTAEPDCPLRRELSHAEIVNAWRVSIRAALLTGPIEHRNGRVAVPTGAGLGIEIDRAALARFRVTS